MSKTFRLFIVLLFCLWQGAGIVSYGQNLPRAAAKRGQTRPDTLSATRPDTFRLPADSLKETESRRVADSIAAENKRRMQEMDTPVTLPETLLPADSLQDAVRSKVWVPNPTKATWLALVIPGAGQIYNRKYWKLPIFYGGFAGCAYALTWNGKMYRDYSNAYREAVNGNWESSYIQDLLPPGYIDRVSTTQLTETLRKRKDNYRRFRDLSIFAFIGVYILSVVDAYVDAELSNFDLTPDLSMRVEPTVFDSRTHSSSFNNKSVGVQCSFRF